MAFTEGAAYFVNTEEFEAYLLEKDRDGTDALQTHTVTLFPLSCRSFS